MVKKKRKNTFMEESQEKRERTENRGRGNNKERNNQGVTINGR